MVDEPEWLVRAGIELGAKQTETSRLRGLWRLFPDLKRYVGRWQKVVFYSPSVNANVTDFESRHNCGCCADSPLEIWPYIETEHGRVYSDPPSFTVGERNGDTDRLFQDWDKNLREKSIPEPVIERIGRMLTEPEV